MSERDELQADIDAVRERIVARVDSLQVRLAPKRLVADSLSEARAVAKREVAEAADNALDWVKDNAVLLTVAAAAGGAVMAWNGFGRAGRGDRPVNIYDAYSMEDPAMHEADESARTWDRVREEAEALGARAGEATREARAAIGDAARRAGDWGRRVPEENPMTAVILGFALGAVAGALLPRTAGETRALGATRDRLAEGARRQAMAVIDAGKARLEEAGVTPEAARAKLDALATKAKDVAHDVGAAAGERLKAAVKG
ncbi:DUF3618 domain-containing protein [Sandaracinobacteroides saxicola]|uniref:DUF3618 domain-containing protein n=1 Tax=Sandaracinobacteroides saxicola TaxID=2759707 RepID=A0A7G5IL48_9SPHN|nr:DUF3618 domain-containing protein [Sandaracinobacteroides saxicola]QMW24090.1 DUF3618 domain-containing protein [Sandaracinobacteroides saxicola]